MKQFTVLLCAALLSGCVGTHPKGTARFDDYDSVKVEQMVGNNVSQAVFAKSIVCLNARRETRRVTGLTNTMVTAVTNQTVSAVTNQTISFSTNLLYTSMTNLAASLPPPPMPTGDAAAAGAETNLVIVASSPAASSSTNVTTSLASNSSGSRAPNQNTANSQVIRTLNQQLTTTTNNLSIALMTNLVFTGETNLIVSYVTNTALVSVTNTVITPTNGVAYDYFLYSELIPPPDFTPQQQGESLVLLVDGVRYGCTVSQSGTAFVSRKGYTSTLYRVSPEVIVAIANAKEVRLRLKGVNNVVERTMSNSSRQNFRSFLGRYFVSPDSGAPAASKPVAAMEEATNVANR
jgi:hypothetical protein